MSTTPPTHLRIGVAIFPQALSLDFIGPLDVLSTLSAKSPTRPESLDFSLTCVILADSLEPMPMSNGMSVVPQMTYDNAMAEDQEWDVVLIPGGSGARPWFESNKGTRDFLVKVGPKCKYVLTVCTGSWLLSATGLLDGQRATSNKRALKSVQEQTKGHNIEWVPKARWVVSDKFWTASGVTAGIDMAAAFVRHIVGLHVGKDKVKEVGDSILGVLEVIEAEQENDPWAEYYGLV